MNFCTWRRSENGEGLRSGLPGGLFAAPTHRFGGPAGTIGELASWSETIEIPAYNPATQTRTEHTNQVVERLKEHHSSQEKV